MLGTIRIHECQVLSPLGVDHDRWDFAFQSNAELGYDITPRGALTAGWTFSSPLGWLGVRWSF